MLERNLVGRGNRKEQSTATGRGGGVCVCLCVCGGGRGARPTTDRALLATKNPRGEKTEILNRNLSIFPDPSFQSSSSRVLSERGQERERERSRWSGKESKD